MFLLNGKRRQFIDIADRGFQYGDGLFETIEVLNGKPLFLDRHLKRLDYGCQKLLIPTPDQTLLTEESLQISANAERAVLKIIVTRGCGGRGYRQPEPILPSRLLSLYNYPDYPAHLQTDGITVRFCHHRLGLNPGLAGIKHLNRLEQVLARAEWRNENILEGLMLDYNDNVVEGTMSNLFIVKDGNLYTPILNECGVAGIVREIIMELAQRNNMALLEKKLQIQALLQADEIFVTNSVIGIWPVNQLEQHRFSVGEKTVALQKMFSAMRLTEA